MNSFMLFIAFHLAAAGAFGQHAVRFMPPEKEAKRTVPPRGAENRVEGRVIHHITGKPLSKIRVYLVSTAGDSSHVEAVTDVNGRFAATGVPWPRYSIRLAERGWRAERIHFEPFDSPEKAVVSASPSSSLRIEVSPTNVPSRISLAQRVGGKVMPPHSFICDGSLTVYGLDKKASTAAIARALDGSLSSELELIKRDASVTLALHAGITVFGRLESGTGIPIEGMKLEVAALCPDSWRGQALPLVVPEEAPGVITGDDGGFQIPSLLPGAYRVRAGPEDFGGFHVDFNVRASGADDLLLTLSANPVVSGRLTDASGEPVTDASVFFHARYRDAVDWYGMDVEKDGTILSPEFPWNSRVFLAVWSYGFLPVMVPDALPGGTRFDVVLQEGATVKGQVTSSKSRKPVKEFDLCWLNEIRSHLPFYREASSPVRATATHLPWKPLHFKDDRGRFTFKGLPEGGNLLTVEARGYFRTTVPVRIDSLDSVVDGLDVELDPLTGLGGTVKIREGLTPPASVIVVPWQVQDEVMTTLIGREGLRMGNIWHKGLLAATTDAAGRFQLDLPPGTYYLHLGKGSHFMNDCQKHGPYEILPGEVPDPLSLEYVEPTGVVAVKVRDENGVPVKGLRVCCGSLERADDGFMAVAGETDAKGRVRLEPIRPGERRVSAVLKKGYATQTLSRAIEVAPHGVTEVELEPDTAPCTGRVQGRVISNGRTLAGVEVTLSTKNVNHSDSTRTRADGSFHFPDVPPGSYRLRSCKSEAIKFEMGPGGETMEKEIIVGSCTMKGFLVCPTGAPSAAGRMRVHLYPKGRSLPVRRSSLKKGGAFEFEYLFQGLYDLHAFGTPHGLHPGSKVDHSQHFVGFVRDIDLRSVRTFEVQLVRAGGLELRMPYSAEDDMFMEVKLCLDDGVEITVDYNNRTINYHGELTSYFYHTLIPGTYKVVLHEEVIRDVNVDSGKITRVDHRLD